MGDKKPPKPNIDFKFLVENSPEIYFIIDKNFKILYINKVLPGYNLSKVIGSSQDKFIHPDDLLISRKALKKAITTGKEISYEVRAGNTKQYLWFLTKAKPIKQKGKVVGFVLTARDITDRKKLENMLKTSESKLSKVFNTNPIIIGISTIKDGKFIDVNNKFLKILGFKRSEVIGKTSDKLKLFVNYQERINLINLLKQKGIIENQVVLIRTNKGDIKKLSFSITTFFLNGENYLLTMAVDVTKQVQAEEKLQESKERFFDIAMCSADWIWEVDKHGRYTYVSGAVKRILGYTEKELIGKTPFEFMPKKEAEKIKKKFSEIVKFKKKIKNLENWNISKQGQKVLLVTSGVPIFDKNKKLIGYRGVDKDITKIRKGEELLKRTNIDLEKEVKKRTSEIIKIERQLAENEKMAFLGNMSAIVAHELRNHLSIIRLATYNLEKAYGNRQDKLFKHLLNINKNIIDLEKIVQEILIFSTQNRINKTKCKIDNLINEVLNDLLNNLITKDIRIHKSFEHNLPAIKVDYGKIYRALKNILINSIQAMQGINNKEISIKVKKINGYIEVKIIDTGKGMNKEELKNIGQPFLTTKSKGLGLGTYIITQIIESHHGSLKYKSQPKKGTECVIRLPIN